MFEKSLSTNIELNLTKYNSKEYKLTMDNDKNHRILDILSRGPLLRALHCYVVFMITLLSRIKETHDS
jgi:hypothetical protein